MTFTGLPADQKRKRSYDLQGLVVGAGKKLRPAVRALGLAPARRPAGGAHLPLWSDLYSLARR